MNTDATAFGGSGLGNMGQVVAADEPALGQPASARVFLPPLATLYLIPGQWNAPQRAVGESEMRQDV
nr:alpha amylase C-terminal domain-containing protein [Plastoroseomonas arctica]